MTAPLLKDALQQRLEKKLKDIYSLNNSNINIKEEISYFEDKNNKSKWELKKYKTLNTKLESVDTIVKIGAISTSATLSIGGVILIILPISTEIVWSLSLG